MVDILKGINWVDIFVLILLVRISYVSSRIGVGRQVLPLILLAVILLFILLGYSKIANVFIEKFSWYKGLSRFLSFTFLAFIFSVIYHVAVRLLGLISTTEPESGQIEKMGGAIAGVARSVIIIGLILIGLLLTPVRFVESSVKRSFFGLFFINLDLQIYNTAVERIFSKTESVHTITQAELLGKKDKYFFKARDLKKESRFFKEKF